MPASTQPLRLVKTMLRSAVVRYSIRNRTRKAALIIQFMADRKVQNVIFVGCGGEINPKNPNAHIVEHAVAEHARVLLAVDVLPYHSMPWPFQRADGRHLPLLDKSTDMILANAVIEHVGAKVDQLKFVAEQSRVGRSWVITTPNRWFPVESHTSAVLLHWSRRWRDSRREFTRLLSLREFRELLPAGTVIHGRPWSSTFVAFYPPP